MTDVMLISTFRVKTEIRARGLEELIGTLMILDHAPNGRIETTTMDWVRRHDEYEGAPETAHRCAS